MNSAMKTTFLLSTTALAVALIYTGLALRPGSQSAARADNQPAAAMTAQAPAALTGQVSSDAEGKMEGAVVTAHKDGSIVSVSVTTDAQGRYSFPENRLEPGHYTLAIRAVGYDLTAPAAGDVAAEQTTKLDLKLDKTKNLASQLNNSEWMQSFPGTEEQKSFLLNCVGCHTLERIARSTHDADEWMQVIPRMMGYGAVSQPVKPQPMLDRSRAGTPEQYRQVAEYLATINLSTTDKWAYPLKTMPRATGASTRAIVTEYSMPRPEIQPHDVVMDKDGNVWYTDFGELFISKFNPKTLQLTEYPVKELKPGSPVGNLSLEFDKSGKLWFDMMYQAGIGTIDPANGKMTYYPLDAKWNDDRVQLNFVGLRHDVDGKVWTKSVGTQDIYRLDVAAGTWERFHPTDALPAGRHYGIYQVISDSKNNLWMAEFDDGHLGKLDAKTQQVTWFSTPTAHARARRMEIDDQDRILLTEYRGNKVAMFDTKTEQFTEYAMPTPYSGPYRAQVDKNGGIWVAGMHTDRVTRLDPKTGQSVEYPLPSDTNMRSLWLDENTTPVTFWTGSNHDHALVKVEPLN
jgi:virginiamycin B lyase